MLSGKLILSPKSHELCLFSLFETQGITNWDNMASEEYNF